MIRQPAKTPEPPYYSVTTTAAFGDAYDATHHAKLGFELYGKASEIDGFLGWEVTVDSELGIAISYWRSLEAIAAWRRHPQHGGAKQLGRLWFRKCITRIASVERAYGFGQP